ncbi:MAG: nucleoside triphosphate pyrophosphatase [Candidatus Heimdallarchaeaceae archaeon]
MSNTKEKVYFGYLALFFVNNKILGLASQSEGRKMLLKLMQIRFISETPIIDEEELKKAYSDDPPEKLVQKLALNKAQSVAKKLFKKGADIVVGADTLITLEGSIIGKPKNSIEAKNLLRKFSNKTHKIISGVAIILPNEEYKANSESALVSFSKINDITAENYTTFFHPEKYAGGYKLLGPSAFFIKKIEGDFSTIIGLPMHMLGEMLKEFGYHWIDFILRRQIV